MLERIGRFLTLVWAVIGIIRNGLFGIAQPGVPMEPQNTLYPTDQYVREAYLTPIWQTGIQYNEALTPLALPDGQLPDFSLLYPIGEVLSVRDSSLAVEYTAGTDYTVASGKLRIPPGSSIPTYPYTFAYPAEASGDFRIQRADDGHYIELGNGTDSFHVTQLAVTYRPAAGTAFPGAIPAPQARFLPHTLTKLENKEPLKLLVLGDSISFGCQASGWGGFQPYMPPYYELVRQSLEAKYSTSIDMVNESIGGKQSDFGAENAAAFAEAHNPDLVILAFGMNDGFGVSVMDYYRNMLKAMSAFRAHNASVEFILVATMLPNPAVAMKSMHAEYLLPLKTLSGRGAALADMTSVTAAVLSRKQNYTDIAGNNFNHPNDWMVRVYAQTVLACFE
ncbi:MAG: SGNH/GDSL hydrolase family protein [Oscillospiraceae bacterium]|jgi:lysophospholipase L1-like esterase|nr:SGNH/GDSL hydrolase family protein [Oscillospiraceae bacterium]